LGTVEKSGQFPDLGPNRVEELEMKMRRWVVILMLAGGLASAGSRTGEAQCCLDGLFAGCSSCFRKAPPAYAVAPVVAPIPAAPPPVVVPVQQVSYVPETTYRTQYKTVPVTTYKPSSEIDPCTGCPRECMQQVTDYVQQAVNVPVTQYRAVYSTKYVQMQQSAPAYGVPAAPVAAPAYPGYVPPPITPIAPGVPAASPFTAPVQTAPQAWGAAGSDIPQQLVPGQTSIAAPTLPQGFVPQGMPPQGGFQSPAVSQPGLPPATFQQQQIVPQAGTYAAPPVQAPLQPTAPPALTPAPSLKPIPDMPRAVPGQAVMPQPGPAPGSAVISPAPSLRPIAPLQPTTPQALAPTTGSGMAPGATVVPSLPGVSGGVGSGTNGPIGMPVVPGAGPNGSTGAFPRLLEPTSHTTSWYPASLRPAVSPTAALPGRLQ